MEDEVTQLAKKLVPQAFVYAFVEHDEKELPKLKLTGVDQYTATEIGDFFRSLQIPLKEVRRDCKGYILPHLSGQSPAPQQRERKRRRKVAAWQRNHEGGKGKGKNQRWP